MKLLLDGKRIINSRGMSIMHFIKKYAAAIEAGKKYKIEVLYRNYAGDADMKLLWAPPRPNMI